MRDPDIDLELRNAEALSRAEDRSLTPPDDAPAPRNPFDPPLQEEAQ